MVNAHPRQLQIQFDQRVPMRDDITLSADIYLPLGSLTTKRPVILERTPYMKAGINFERAKYFVRYGYVFVVMDVRGRGDSDGEFIPYFHEGRDGYDAIEWCALQPWSDGNVGTIGAAYAGRIQWLAAIERPPHLQTMIVLVPPSDPFLETPIRYQQDFEQVNVPVLHISGDNEQVGTPLDYIGTTTLAVTPEACGRQQFLMSPWDHTTNISDQQGEINFGPQPVIDLLTVQRHWYDRWLKKPNPSTVILPIIAHK